MSTDERTPTVAPSKPAVVPPEDWSTWPDERLLELRICQLGVTIEGSPIEARIADLQHELDARGLTFNPHFWLSAEWFSPDSVPGVAIPFYLAHPRLEKLERAQMLEVEGGTPEWCLKILRHEAGHAIDNAYKLRERLRRQQIFGPSYIEYPEYYTPKPYSKSFVLHLDSWYSQSHPDEDFAETFAVWLKPDSQWRERYARKRAHCGYEYRNFFDRDLMRLFTKASDAPRGSPPATRFLGKIRKDVCRRVSRWTGEYRYTIDRVFEDMITRCRELSLRVSKPEDEARLEFTILLTVQTMNYLHSGRHRVAL